MEKIAIGLALTILFFLIIAACQPPTVEEPSADDRCRDLEGLARDDCYFEERKCSKIQALQIRDSCVAELAKAKEDINVCNLILDSKVKGYCQEQLAEITNNHDVCSAIEDQYWQDNCNYHLGLSNEKDAYCSLIKNAEQRDECFETMAIETNNKFICEFLSGDKKGRCLFIIATSLHDIEICQEIETSFNQDVCRKKISRETGNKEICELIGNPIIKDDCLKQI